MTETNIIKAVCEKYALSHQELADKIGASHSNVASSASSGKISNRMKTAIELYVENQELKKELNTPSTISKEDIEDFNALKHLLSNILKK